jgi:hypothetical protein
METSITDDVELDLRDSQPWADYRLPDNRVLRLPADAWSRMKYARRGWRLVPKTESRNLEKGG